MKSSYYKATHFAAYLTILHGLWYLIVKYFFKVEGPYGPRPHWTQSYLQSAHILLSPLFLFAFGMLWKGHIVKKFKKSTRKRISGISLVALVIVMIVSGYGIQAFYNESIKNVQVWAHLISGSLFCLVYLMHHFNKR